MFEAAITFTLKSGMSLQWNVSGSFLAFGGAYISLAVDMRWVVKGYSLAVVFDTLRSFIFPEAFMVEEPRRFLGLSFPYGIQEPLVKAFLLLALGCASLLLAAGLLQLVRAYECRASIDPVELTTFNC